MRTTTPAPSARPAAGGARWRLNPRVRKTTLVVHLVSAGAWIGIDVIVATLVAAGWFSDDPSVRGAAYQALGLFVVWPMLVTGLSTLASGLVLGLGSKWGLVRYWWVAVKLGLNLALCALIVVLLRPGLAEVREHGLSVSAGGPGTVDVADLFFPPAVSLSALTLATVLAVFKPWGRTRSGTPR